MLIVVAGPMFAGKTTWLLNYTKTLPEQSFQLFKPTIDTRYANTAIVSHNGDTLPAINLDIDIPTFPFIRKTIKTILVDELNFFHPEKLLPTLQKQMAMGRSIVAVGLMYDFQKKPFGATPSLAKIADRFIQLYATCDGCGKKARHSYRKLQEKAQFMLGASESYGPCCTTCWKLLQR